MSFLKKFFGNSVKLDGEELIQSTDVKQLAQLDLLKRFNEARPLHVPGEQQRWSRALPQSYAETIELLTKQGWLEANANGEYRTTAVAAPILQAYQERLDREKAAVMPRVRAALVNKETSEALSLRRAYEARFPLGESEWSGPEPQLSHSALTRRIFFLEHWLLDGLSQETKDWLKLYAAEQHLWGASWHVPEAEIPEIVRSELSRPDMEISEAVYWKAQQLSLYVDNQETWQRCKGGDHVRRIEMMGPNDEYTCETCRATLGKEFLVVRVPELPHRECTSPRGCRCRYEPVLEMLEDIEA